MLVVDLPVEEGIQSEEDFLKDTKQVEGLIDVDGVVFKAVKYRTGTQLKGIIETLDLK